MSDRELILRSLLAVMDAVEDLAGEIDDLRTEYADWTCKRAVDARVRVQTGPEEWDTSQLPLLVRDRLTKGGE